LVSRSTFSVPPLVGLQTLARTEAWYAMYQWRYFAGHIAPFFSKTATIICTQLFDVVADQGRGRQDTVSLDAMFNTNRLNDEHAAGDLVHIFACIKFQRFGLYSWAVMRNRFCYLQVLCSRLDSLMSQLLAHHQVKEGQNEDVRCSSPPKCTSFILCFVRRKLMEPAKCTGVRSSWLWCTQVHEHTSKLL
jgi:hypothetical protein